ncbi:Kelch motif protein [compost metagenome]
MYIYGGQDGGGVVNTLYEYDPGTDTWSTKAAGPVPTHVHKAGAISGVMYVYGGYDGSASTNTFYEYTP